MAAEPATMPAPAGASFAVVVDYTADDAHFEQLKQLVFGVAKASIAEPGCLRFDVVMPTNSARHLTLYEVFVDKAAFDLHTATPAFRTFAVDSAALGAQRVATPGTTLLSLHKS